MASLAQAAREGESRGVHLFFSRKAHFLDPLVRSEFALMVNLDLPETVVDCVRRIVGECQGPAIHFPLPLDRALAGGSSWRQAVDRFRYDMIRVDDNQRWTWRGQPVAARTKDFFLQHLRWQPEVQRYYFEYKVHEGWWDKSYLEVAVSPLLAGRLEVVVAGPEAEVRAHLASGQRPTVELDSFRLDANERLFVGTDGYGEVLVAEAERFKILRKVEEGLTRVDFAGALRRLQWTT